MAFEFKCFAVAGDELPWNFQSELYRRLWDLLAHSKLMENESFCSTSSAIERASSGDDAGHMDREYDRHICQSIWQRMHPSGRAAHTLRLNETPERDAQKRITLEVAETVWNGIRFIRSKSWVRASNLENNQLESFFENSLLEYLKSNLLSFFIREKHLGERGI